MVTTLMADVKELPNREQAIKLVTKAAPVIYFNNGKFGMVQLTSMGMLDRVPTKRDLILLLP